MLNHLTDIVRDRGLNRGAPVRPRFLIRDRKPLLNREAG